MLGRREEARDVAQLNETLLGREPENACHVVEHVRVGHRRGIGARPQLESSRDEQRCERIPARAGATELDPSDNRLRGPRALGELALAQAGAVPCGTQQDAGGITSHIAMIANKLSRGNPAIHCGLIRRGDHAAAISRGSARNCGPESIPQRTLGGTRRLGLSDLLGAGPVAVDTAVFIYLLEEHPTFLGAVRPLFVAATRGELELVTSAITLLEVLVIPYRASNVALATRYEALLAGSRGLRLVDVDRPQLRTAAQLRALYRLLTKLFILTPQAAMYVNASKYKYAPARGDPRAVILGRGCSTGGSVIAYRNATTIALNATKRPQWSLLVSTCEYSSAERGVDEVHVEDGSRALRAIRAIRAIRAHGYDVHPQIVAHLGGRKSTQTVVSIYQQPDEATQRGEGTLTHQSRSYRMCKRDRSLVTDREGFEPSIRFHAYTLSRRAPSTARPPVQLILKNTNTPALKNGAAVYA